MALPSTLEVPHPTSLTYSPLVLLHWIHHVSTSPSATWSLLTPVHQRLDLICVTSFSSHFNYLQKASTTSFSMTAINSAQDIPALPGLLNFSHCFCSTSFRDSPSSAYALWVLQDAVLTLFFSWLNTSQPLGPHTPPTLKCTKLTIRVSCELTSLWTYHSSPTCLYRQPFFYFLWIILSGLQISPQCHILQEILGIPSLDSYTAWSICWLPSFWPHHSTLSFFISLASETECSMHSIFSSLKYPAIAGMLKTPNKLLLSE